MRISYERGSLDEAQAASEPQVPYSIMPPPEPDEPPTLLHHREHHRNDPE